MMKLMFKMQKCEEDVLKKIVLLSSSHALFEE